MPRTKKNKHKTSTLQSLKTDLKNPKSKTRVTLSVVLLVFVLGIVGLMLVENNRHNKLYASAERLAAQIESKGVNVSEVYTVCNKSGVGKGTITWHQCTMHFTRKHRAITIEAGNDIVRKLNEVIVSTADFTRENDNFLGFIDEKGRNLKNAGVGFTHEPTGTACSLYYDSSLWPDNAVNSINFEIMFICDDDSWFNKTFRN